MPNYYEESLDLHARLNGKLEIASKIQIRTKDDLSVAYTPGVAAPCEEIFEQPKLARSLTMKHNSVAVLSDGSAVLGLGNIGPLAAIPVMEGKAILFKQYADIDAWPICLDTQDTEEIIRTVRNIAPVFGGINLEDIAAPRCFEVEDALQDLGIPVFHDDQHGTAIVCVAAIINACKVAGKELSKLRVVINGAGAAGVAIAKMLCGKNSHKIEPMVEEVVICDSTGVISRERDGLSWVKKDLLEYTNPHNRAGTLKDVLPEMDVFIGVSKGNLLNRDDVAGMRKDPIILAMANPVPEILPEEARAGGASVIGTGRSDFPNQVNNVLAFPGIFRGALDAQAPRITNKMKMAAVYALANYIEHPTWDKILPSPLNQEIATVIGKAVEAAAREDFA